MRGWSRTRAGEGATGLLQQRLSAAYAGEFDAKDHAKIPDDGGNRRPRAACRHFQIDFRERKLIDRSVEDFTARTVGANSVFEQSNPPTPLTLVQSPNSRNVVILYGLGDDDRIYLLSRWLSKSS